MNILIPRSELLTKFKTMDGGYFEMISMKGNQCPKCLDVLHMYVSKEDKNIVVIEECRCMKENNDRN